MNKQKFEQVIKDLKDFNIQLRNEKYIQHEVETGWYDEVVITQESDWEIKYNTIYDTFELYTTFSNQKITQHAINLMQNLLNIIK